MAPLLVPVRGLKLQVSKWELVREYCYPNKEFDHANLVGGCKSIIDVLVSSGVIQDDAPKYFDCEYSQVKADRTQVRLRLLRHT